MHHAPRIEAVIFDMDGLLIDSEHLWRKAETKVMNGIGVPMVEEDGFLTMGLRTDEVVEFWHARHPWSSPPKKEIEGRIVRGVIDLIEERGVPLPGALETVRLLSEAGYPMGIASSSANDIITAVVDKLGLRPFMKVLQSAEHEPYGKPHPAVYIEAARRLGVDPARCLAFEDSPNGVLAAKAAKMRCIAVPELAMRGDRRFGIADLVLETLDGFSLDVLDAL